MPALREQAEKLKKLRPPRLWHGRSVRTHILIVIGAINLLAVFVVGTLLVVNTRVATRLEIESSFEVAQRLVDATAKDLAAEGRLDQLDDVLPYALKHLRHVRIMLVDSFGNLTVVSRAPDLVDGKPVKQWVPKWFKSLVGPKLVRRTVLLSSANGTMPVIIAGDPTDELAEAWREFFTFILAWVGLNAVILLILSAALGRVLNPLVTFSRGLLNLEAGDYATRLKPPKQQEIALITNRFNTLACALGTARDENARLYQQLMQVQERERREIAAELHDEAGPCLFGITANAASIKAIAEQLPNNGPEIERRVDQIQSIAERLKLMNRALLKKLRPGSLGRVGIAESVDELIAGFHGLHPETRIVARVGRLAQSYGEAIDLALYRCIQEGVTNALRHGQGGKITIELSEKREASWNLKQSLLCLSVRDDGQGFDAASPKGFGLTSMTERLRALGGTCSIESGLGEGTTISVVIPVERRPAKRMRQAEPAGALS
jgi:two-component system, NarL family, sensor histidine kinase UhpB